MTINSQTRTAGPFNGTGGIISCPFSFKVFQASDLLVAQTDPSGAQTILVLSVGYSVVLNPDQNTNPGGTVTTLAALPSGYSIGLTSNIPVTQPLSLTNAGGFYPRAIEDELDRLTILMQQQGFVVTAQTLRVPEIAGVPPLAAAAARANRVLAFDANGNPILIVGVDADSAAALALDLANSANAAKGAGQIGFGYGLVYAAGSIGKWLQNLATSVGAGFIGFIQWGAGANLRTVQDKLRDSINARDFGVVADKVTDDTAALQRAVDFAATYTHGCWVDLPPGSCLISAPITITKSYVKLRGTNRYGQNNAPQIMGSGIYTETSGLDSIIKVNIPGAAIYGVVLENLTVSAKAGLAQPPVGIHCKDASEVIITNCVAAGGLTDGIKLNGVDIINISDYSTSVSGDVGIRLTIDTTSVFLSNDIVWMKGLNIYSRATAAIVIDSFSNDIQVQGYAEFVPVGVLLQTKTGTNSLVDGLDLDGFHVFNGPTSPYIGVSRFLKAIAPAGAANYLRTTNIRARSCRSYQTGSTLHIELLHNGNSNATTAYLNTQIDGGQWYSASGALVYCDDTKATGDLRGNIMCVAGYQTGAAVPLRSGSGTEGWGTEEAGTWTPTDASGAALVFTNVEATFVRKGTMCFATLAVTYPATANASSAAIGGLPFLPKASASSMYGGSIDYTDAGTLFSALINTGVATFGLWSAAGGAVLNSAMSGKRVRATLIYESQ